MVVRPWLLQRTVVAAPAVRPWVSFVVPPPLGVGLCQVPPPLGLGLGQVPPPLGFGLCRVTFAVGLRSMSSCLRREASVFVMCLRR